MRKAIIAASMFVSATAFAGPFGLEMGTSVKDLKAKMNLEESIPHVYTSTNPPEPHTKFDQYTVIATPEHGLCKVSAHMKVQTNAFGTQVQSETEKLLSALTKRYGAPTGTYDFLYAGSVWDDPDDWMMALLLEERALVHFWKEPENAGDIAVLGLTVTATTVRHAVVTLSYEFTNASACLDWRNADDDASL